jgi:hypothetical protein
LDLPKPEKPPTLLHEIATWAFMAGVIFGFWWIYSVWQIYRSDGATAIVQFFNNWRLYITGACLLVSFGVHLLAETGKIGKR